LFSHIFLKLLYYTFEHTTRWYLFYSIRLMTSRFDCQKSLYYYFFFFLTPTKIMDVSTYIQYKIFSTFWFGLLRVDTNTTNRNLINHRQQLGLIEDGRFITIKKNGYWTIHLSEMHIAFSCRLKNVLRYYVFNVVLKLFLIHGRDTFY
jgi:hypothetical protein